jgi:hypothetical protein
MRMMVLLTLALAFAGVSGASAVPVTSIGTAIEASAVVSDAAEFFLQDGRCYLQGRKYNRPAPMEKCTAQRRPAGH